MSERPRFRVNEVSFIGHALVQPGAEVYYTPADAKPGQPVPGVGANLSPLNDLAQTVVDNQTADHPDKAKHREAKGAAKAAKTAEEKEKEAERDDGLVPANAAQGDTRTAAQKKADAKAAKATQAGADKPDKAESAADEDIG